MTENWYETLSATDGLPTEDDEQNRTEQNANQSCGEILDSTSWQTHILTSRAQPSCSRRRNMQGFLLWIHGPSSHNSDKNCQIGLGEAAGRWSPRGVWWGRLFRLFRGAQRAKSCMTETLSIPSIPFISSETRTSVFKKLHFFNYQPMKYFWLNSPIWLSQIEEDIRTLQRRSLHQNLTSFAQDVERNSFVMKVKTKHIFVIYFSRKFISVTVLTRVYLSYGSS